MTEVGVPFDTKKSHQNGTKSLEEIDNGSSHGENNNDVLVETFKKGDRVIVTNIPIATVTSSTIYGQRRHGHIVAIGTQYYAIHLDSGNGIGKFQTVLVAPNRVRKETNNSSNNNDSVVPLSCTIQNRATVKNGALVHGIPIHDGMGCHRTYNAAAMIGTMHLIRWITATSVSATITTATSETTKENINTKNYQNLSLEQIQQISTKDCYLLNEIAIQNWLCINNNDTNVDSDNNTNKNKGIYQRLVQYMEQEQIHSNFVLDALNDIRSMKSWYKSIQHNFWFVAKDDCGSYIIPDCNSHEHVVYKVIGLGNSVPLIQPNHVVNNNPVQQQAPVRLIRIPMRLQVTIVPWYGRLLHDTSIPLPNMQQHQQQANEFVTLATDPIKARRLHTVVLHAIQTGTVIEHFAELENSVTV